MARVLDSTVLDDHFRAVVDSSDDAILTKDAEGIITSWNPAAQKLYGYSEEEAVGNSIAMLVPKHRAGEERRILSRILQGQRVDHYETERVTKDGRIVVVSLTISPIRDAERTITGASVIARDVTAQRRAAERAERLQRLMASLSRQLTPERTIEVLLAEAVPALGAVAGAVGMVDESETCIAIASSVGYSAAGMDPWLQFPLDADVPMSEAVRNRKPVWLESPAELAERYPVFQDTELRFGALAVVPLVIQEHGFGAISLSFDDAREFGPEERAFVMSMIQQAAYALERTRLYTAEQEARKSLEFLARASEVLSGSLDADRTLEQLAFLAVPRIADWCSVHLADEEEGLRNVVVAHADPERAEVAREFQERYPLDPDAPTGVPNVIRTAQPELYEEISDELLKEGAQDAEHLEAIRELGLKSAMILPLIARGRVLGALTLTAAESDRRFGAADLELAMDLARRAAMAIDNSALYRREHDAAVTLQRALLPARLPTLARAELASRYLPAETAFEVGGDWYDVVENDFGQVTLTVGDVAGHGTRAASVMGQLRTALRAYTSDGHRPRESMDRLNRLLLDFDEPQMATVLQIYFDPEKLSGQFVRAGHLPPLLRRPSGAVETAEGTPSPPLGVFPDALYETAQLTLEPGSTLLMYTDGLVERRDATIDHGLRWLRQKLSDAPPGAQTCVDFILDGFTSHSDDDVAIVALRVNGGSFGADGSEEPG